MPPVVHDPNPSRQVWSVAEWVWPRRWCAAPEGTPCLRHVSLELAGEAARLAGEVGGAASAVLLGYGVEPLAEPLAQAGAAEVLLADAPKTGAVHHGGICLGAGPRHQGEAALGGAAARDLLRPRASSAGSGSPGAGPHGRLPGPGARPGGRTAAAPSPRSAGSCAYRQPHPTRAGCPALRRAAPLRPGYHESRAHHKPRSRRPATMRVQVVEDTHEGEAGPALDHARLVVCGHRHRRPGSAG